jgi:hypothetical protein
MRTPKDRTDLLYKFSLTEYVPEAHWNASRIFEIDPNMNRHLFILDPVMNGTIKYNQTMPDARKFVLSDIPQYTK